MRFAAAILIALCLSSQAAKLHLVPTFENCSVYVEETDMAPRQLRIEYRQQGTEAWLAAHELVNSVNKPAPRTSLFLLKENTVYEVRCLTLDGKAIAEASVTTWPEAIPIARTVQVTANEPLLIKENGKPDGWIKYTAARDYVLDGGNSDIEAILIENASYVILEGITIVGGKRHGIHVKNSHHVRIVNCDISGFGRVGELRNGITYEPGSETRINYDAGVYLNLAEQTVIEKCYIHDPRNRANSWAYGHPLGPTAVFLRIGPRGGLVLRYNDLIGSQEHRWNDVVEGYGNGKPHGGPRRDADIYGNFMAFPNDDCIELDGRQENIRFYGNKLEGGLCGISTAPNMYGPTYIFNNLVVNLGDDRWVASAGVKNGGGSTYSKGMTYFYNNTFFSYGRGITGVGFGRDKNRQLFLAKSRNNILAVGASGISDRWSPPQNDFDYDLFITPQGSPGQFSIGRKMEQNAVLADPQFVDPAVGDFRLKLGSPAAEGGVPIPGLHVGKRMGASGDLIPWRKGGVLADKYQIKLEGIRGGEAPQTSVMLSSTKKQSFRILKNRVFGWLKVTPESGTLSSGSKLALTVSLDMSKAPDGLIPGAFVVKLGSGDSLPITVYSDVAKSAYSQAFQAVDSPGAEVFKREVVDGVDCLNFSENREKGIALKVDVPVDGRYYLYAHIKCPKPYPMHDSLFVGINGSPLIRCGIAAGDAWHWAAPSSKVPILMLKTGVNEVVVAQREGIYLSALFISSKPLFPADKIVLKQETKKVDHVPELPTP